MAKKTDREESIKKDALKLIGKYLPDMDTLDQDRAKALRDYKSEPYGNELKGRSQVVMSDVSDTIEWIMPSLMRIFYGGKDVVTVEPVGPEDELKAKLMEEKLNFDFKKQNNGFLIFYDWFKDALLYRVGLVKYHWHKGEKYKAVEYDGLSEQEYELLTALVDEGKFIIDKENVVQVGEGTGEDDFYLTSVTFSVSGREVVRESRPVLEVMHPSEVIYDAKAKDFGSSRLVAHKLFRHIKEISATYDIDVEDVRADVDTAQDLLSDEIFKALGGYSFIKEENIDDHAYIYECYMDEIGDDGKPRPVKFVLMGDRLLKRRGESSAIEDNRYGRPPFRELTPIRITHSITGRSMRDLATELQKMHTALKRYLLDNIYFQNNGVKMVNPYKVNMDDLINNNFPGGVVRTLYDTSPGDAIYPVPIAPMQPQVFNMLEMVQQERENRTGVSRLNQGIDPKNLNDTATGISQIMGASQQRIEMIARMFAETGVKQLFQDIVDMNVEFFDTETNIKINQEWQRVRPEDISGQFDVNVDVAIGTGGKEIKVQQMLQMLNTYLLTAKLGAPVSPDKIYAMLREIWHSWGYKNADTYVPSEKDAEQNEQMTQIIGLLVQQMQAAGVPVPPQIQQLLEGGRPDDVGDISEQGRPGIPGAPAGGAAPTADAPGASSQFPA